MRRTTRRPDRSRMRNAQPTIQKGDTGSAVRLCQTLLNEHGFQTTVDGIFGSGTDAKVRAFQVSRGLVSDGVVGPNTWAALRATVKAPGPLPQILQHAVSLGHAIPWVGDHHLWLFGIRSPSRQANLFDDTLGAAYTVNGLWKIHQWPGTTDPGTYWLENPSRVEGTAILVPGQYKDVWKIEKHNDQYDALCQRNGKVRVYRDADRDAILEMDARSIQEGSFGINIHRSSSTGTSTRVDKWSAGCQVHATIAGFNEMMSLARKQVAATGRSTFTYTLMDQWWTGTRAYL